MLMPYLMFAAVISKNPQVKRDVRTQTPFTIIVTDIISTQFIPYVIYVHMIGPRDIPFASKR